MNQTLHKIVLPKKGSPEHNAWRNMRRRCSSPNYRAFHRHGGRGIRVCGRWQKFANFYADMGPRPTNQHTLDLRANAQRRTATLAGAGTKARSSMDSTNWWRDGMMYRTQLPFLTYGECLELVVKRYKRERLVIKDAGSIQGTLL